MELSDKEKNIISDQEFLISKVLIIDKILLLFEEIRTDLINVTKSISFNFPVEVDNKIGKIFKGENYCSLPYVNLDYPKYFRGNDVFTLRTMFWWGNFFSNTLHLSGKYYELYKENIINNFDLLLSQEFYICINSSPWEYHYNKDNYINIREVKKEILSTLPFLKISKKYNLGEYNNIRNLSSDYYKNCIKFISET